MLYLVSCIYDFTAPGLLHVERSHAIKENILSPVVMSSWKWDGMGWYVTMPFFAEKNHTGVVSRAQARTTSLVLQNCVM